MRPSTSFRWVPQPPSMTSVASAGPPARSSGCTEVARDRSAGPQIGRLTRRAWSAQTISSRPDWAATRRHARIASTGRGVSATGRRGSPAAGVERAHYVACGIVVRHYTQKMNILGYIVVAALACCLVLPLLNALAWCLGDLRRDSMVDSSARAQWLGALLLLSVVAIPMHVSGPGRKRWNPRTLWWPWRR
jgi:hypothetical protein